MGTDKATLVVEGSPMAARAAAALRAAGATEVWAVGGDAPGLGALGLEVVPDERPGGGPFPATITALRRAAPSIVVVLSCDLLSPSAAAVTRVVDVLARGAPGAHAAVPVDDEGHHQWTHTAWRASALPVLEARYEAGIRSLRRAAVALDLLEVRGLDPASLRDADRPGDLGG
jgi:molybdopterin-guanine dinucleotide biosynthesis protein A